MARPKKSTPVEGVQYEYLSPDEVAKVFRISRAAVYKAITDGELKARKFTRRLYRVHRTEAERWFAAGIK